MNSEQQDIEERKKDAIKRIDGVIANLFWRNNRSFIVSYFTGKDSYNYITHTDFCIRTKIVCVNGLKFQMYAIWSKDLAAFQIFKTENELLDYMCYNNRFATLACRIFTLVGTGGPAPWRWPFPDR